MLDEYTARNNKALTELLNKHGVDLRKLPDSVLIELRRISDDVMQDFIEDDPMAQKFINRIQHLKRRLSTIIEFLRRLT